MGQSTDETFEKQLEYLEKITLELESGELPLAQSLEIYEKGLQVVKKAQLTLAKAKEKMDYLETEYGSQLPTEKKES
jgi:exodeoxyribonuclease VII small subunit